MPDIRGVQEGKSLESLVVYDLRPRTRHWIFIGSLFSAAGAIALTALLSQMTLLAVASVAAWFILNFVVLWSKVLPRASILTVLLAVVTALVLSQTESPFNVMVYTVMVMTVVVTVRLHYSATVVATVAAFNATLVHPIPPQHVWDLAPFLIAFPMAFIYFLALAVRQTVAERLKVEALAATVSKQNERLRISNEQLDRMAAREERTRIARDLHDRLGHALMTINIYLRVLEGRALADEQGARAAARALEATERAMRELRRCVGLLRESQAEPMLSSAIKRLVMALPRPPEVDVQITGTPRSVDPVKEVIIFRVLQEALTNVVKHANAGQVSVELAYQDDTLELSVTDDGIGPIEVDPGYGLRGLSERLDQVGGKLAVGSYAGEGFTLTARVPVPAPAGSRTTSDRTVSTSSITAPSVESGRHHLPGAKCSEHPVAPPHDSGAMDARAKSSDGAFGGRGESH